MLTTSVNIAVFAAFSFCIRDDLLSNAAFKPVCRLRELDIARYGWQKRQDRGNKVARDGKAGGKNGNGARGYGHLHTLSRLPRLRLHVGEDGPFGTGIRLFKVLVARGGTA